MCRYIVGLKEKELYYSSMCLTNYGETNNKLFLHRNLQAAGKFFDYPMCELKTRSGQIRNCIPPVLGTNNNNNNNNNNYYYYYYYYTCRQKVARRLFPSKLPALKLSIIKKKHLN